MLASKAVVIDQVSGKEYEININIDDIPDNGYVVVYLAEGDVNLATLTVTNIKDVGKSARLIESYLSNSSSHFGKLLYSGRYKVHRFRSHFAKHWLLDSNKLEWHMSAVTVSTKHDSPDIRDLTYKKFSGADIRLSKTVKERVLNSISKFGDEPYLSR